MTPREITELAKIAGVRPFDVRPFRTFNGASLGGAGQGLISFTVPAGRCAVLTKFVVDSYPESEATGDPATRHPEKRVAYAYDDQLIFVVPVTLYPSSLNYRSFLGRTFIPLDSGLFRLLFSGNASFTNMTIEGFEFPSSSLRALSRIKVAIS